MPGKTIFGWAVYAEQIAACIQRQVRALRSAPVLPCSGCRRGAVGEGKGRLKSLSSTIELGAPGDQIAAMGDVRLNGCINFTGDPSAFGSGSFLSYGGTLVDAGIVIGSLPDGLDPRAYVFDFSTPGLVGVMQAVPETGTGLLMSLGGLALLLTSSKRRTQAVAP